jgi:SET domain-containing protein
MANFPREISLLSVETNFPNRLSAMPENFRIAPSPIHGQGGFATGLLRQGARVTEYLGERITKAESLRRCQAQNWFIFGLDDEFDLDGNVAWNPARFLNHSCAPNCEAVCEEGRVWIVALRDILPGEEITFNYGFDLLDYDEHPCRCGATECVGYIVAEDFFAKVGRRYGQHGSSRSLRLAIGSPI